MGGKPYDRVHLRPNLGVFFLAMLYLGKGFDEQAAIAYTKDFLQTTGEVVSQAF